MQKVKCKLCGKDADFAHFGTENCTSRRALANVLPSTFMRVAIQLLGWPKCTLIMSPDKISTHSNSGISDETFVQNPEAWTSGLPTFDSTAGPGSQEPPAYRANSTWPQVGSGVLGHAGSRYSPEEMWQVLMQHGCCAQRDAQGFHISWNCHFNFEQFNSCEVPMVSAMCDLTAQRIQELYQQQPW